MDFYELAKKRYSVRSFSEKQVEPEKLEKILEAGRATPTAKNGQPQKIYVLRSESALGKINSVCRCIFGAKTVIAVGYDENRDWKKRSCALRAGFRRTIPRSISQGRKWRCASHSSARSWRSGDKHQGEAEIKNYKIKIKSNKEIKKIERSTRAAVEDSRQFFCVSSFCVSYPFLLLSFFCPFPVFFLFVSWKICEKFAKNHKM